MDHQTIIVFAVILLAAVYVGRRLWRTKKAQSGCSMCPHNHQRADDYA
ncbi:MAG: FeoB-associated Cys-rich membrane protein [Deltaproteobacteria bacterium]|nr:FeoB-associated Cys-rich membrane protein [Deltaproteobacteria bacterium]